MKPKPPPAAHREALVRVLNDALKRTDAALDGWLDGAPGRFTLVSWTSLWYAERRNIALDLAGIERLLAEPVPSAADIREIERFGRKLRRFWHLVGDSYPLLTRISAPAALRETLGEVYRYLDDRDGAATRIRSLVREPLLDAWRSDARVIVIGHSLGSVLAYDTLWELSVAERIPGRVDMLVTLGSPIATRFIRMQLKGAARRDAERYPSCIGRWLNVSARGELVALHPRVAPFFREMVTGGLVDSITDREIYNHFRGSIGLDVHKSYGYVHHPIVGRAVAEWITGGG